MSERRYIEQKLRRSAGMSESALEALHAASDTVEWSGRCWNCRAPFSALPSQICRCASCNANLKSRT